MPEPGDGSLARDKNRRVEFPGAEDGSRVNAIVPPLAIDGPALTIRKFKKDKLTLDQLVKFGAITAGGCGYSADHRPRPLQRSDFRRYRSGKTTLQRTRPMICRNIRTLRRGWRRT